MVAIGIFAGAAGLLLVPMLLGRLFSNKECLATILSAVVASALFFCARVVLPQISGGVLLVYVGVVFVNICMTPGYRYQRKDGGMDKRYSAKNNPFIEGLFSGAMLRAIIAILLMPIKSLLVATWVPWALSLASLAASLQGYMKYLKFCFNKGCYT
jgi:hypothetical protein